MTAGKITFFWTYASMNVLALTRRDLPEPGTSLTMSLQSSLLSTPFYSNCEATVYTGTVQGWGTFFAQGAIKPTYF